MNIEGIFGTLLSILCIGGFTYTAGLFVNSSGERYERFREHKMNYKIAYRGEAQKTIGDRPEEINLRFKSDDKGEDKTKGYEADSVKHYDH